MSKTKPNRRIGLQVKSVLVLAIVVLAATATGGSLYYAVTKRILQRNDHQRAERLASGLAVAAAPSLARGDRAALQIMVTELLSHSDVHHVCILDPTGMTVASAERVVPGVYRPQLLPEPASVSYDLARGTGFLEMGRPAVLPASGGADALAGAVRVVVDISETAAILRNVQQQVALIAAAVALCAMPLGYLLVWRVFVQPVRRLAQTTRKLGEGDFYARAEACGNDEIGELANAFDVMAERLQASQRQLQRANESLERKVAERTHDLEHANGRLRQEMAEKEDFLRAVSHDLNAPLRNVAGMVTMLTAKWRQRLPEDVLARLERIQANVDTETELINELLELSRIKTRPQARRWVDFGELLAQVKDAFEYDLQHRGITLEIHPPMPRLHVERNRMRQVFQNLIDNAIKYMSDREDARIEIDYALVDRMHRFRVSDNGPSIAPDDQDRIFYVFRRAATTRAAKVPGKGIGLALVRSVATNYDGRAWVESAPGAGAAFYVELNTHSTGPPAGGPEPDTAEGVGAAAAANQ